MKQTEVKPSLWAEPKKAVQLLKAPEQKKSNISSGEIEQVMQSGWTPELLTKAFGGKYNG